MEGSIRLEPVLPFCVTYILHLRLPIGAMFGGNYGIMYVILHTLFIVRYQCTTDAIALGIISMQMPVL